MKEKKMTKEQRKAVNHLLSEKMSDQDNWGPACPSCPYWGQATKACSEGCLSPRERKMAGLEPGVVYHI